MDSVPSGVVQISAHAMERFRERFGPQSTEDEVRSLLTRAEPAPSWIRKQLNLDASDTGVPREAFVADQTVLVVAVYPWKRIVATVTNLNWYARTKSKVKARVRRRTV